jgi:Uma2 family endonuclease
MSPTGVGHWVALSRLMFSIAEYLKTNPIGNLWAAETGFLLHRNPDTVLAPDLALTPAVASRKPGIDDQGYVTELPVLVIEVKSSSDREAHIARKLGLYLAAGVPEVWWVRPQQRQVSIHRQDLAPEILSDGALESNDILPGFRLPLRDLFAQEIV